ncbi:MAG TPA: hydrogenase maturation protease [Phycisphaerae bacterium]|nr:hydrogenase maturation protease [Phycisphaerae bacterium]
MKRIICIGNRFEPQDSAGSLVYDRLMETLLPPDVEVIDGGLAGLDLLHFLEGAQRVVFVDAVSGFDTPGGIAVLTAEQAARSVGATFDHSAGLAYLLGSLNGALDGPVPEVFVVGIAGIPDHDTIMTAVDLALSITAEGYREGCRPAAPISGDAR